MERKAMFIVCNDKPSNIQFSVGSKRARKREREQKLCLILYLLWRFFSKVKSICLWHQIVRSTYFFFSFSSCQAYTIQNPHTQQTADRKPMKIYFWERWKTINGNSLVNGSVWVGGEALRVNTILKRLFAPLLDHCLLLVLNKKWKCKQQPQQRRRRQKQSFTSSSSSLSSLWLAFSVCVRFCWHAHIHKSHATNWFQA